MTKPKEKPKKTFPEIKNNQYLTDDLLFILWRLSEIELRKDWSFLFMNITPPVGWINERVINCLFRLKNQFSLEFTNPKFELSFLKDSIPSDFNSTESLESVIKYINHCKTETKEPLLEKSPLSHSKGINAVDKLLKGGVITMEDVELLDKAIMSIEVKKVIMGGIWFEIKLNKTAKNKLNKFLNKYLSNFIENKLSKPYQTGDYSFTKPQNFLTFERHLSLSIEKLKELKINYGKQFILLGRLSEEKGFLHVNFLLALEKLGYIKIKYLGTNSGAYTHGDNPKYEALIVLQEKFNELIEKTKKKQEVSFNLEESVLDIGEKSVKFRKFTEQYHVLRVLFKNKESISKEWFFSEIGEKMDFSKNYTDKHFHNYLSGIKRKIASDTGIKDLFITTTQSVKINKKYLR